jgi:hypothetical protein
MFSYQWYRGNLSKRAVCEQVVPYPVLGQVKRLSKLQSFDNIYFTIRKSFHTILRWGQTLRLHVGSAGATSSVNIWNAT